ncbi:MAG: type II secretion system minor pseudopilin GspH [Gammaproteobacteria bacterium]|nr:type II secretion system minor pseudopilin GspH [Gammaproteobacteria bacterium]
MTATRRFDSNVDHGFRIGNISRGFTLIEILVVITLIGIVATFISLTMLDRGAHDLKEQSRRLAALIRTAHEDSVLYGRNMGMSIGKRDYRFFEFEAGQWHAITAKDIYRPRQLPGILYLQLKLDDINVIMDNDAPATPQIFFLASGEISPFDLTFRLLDRPEYRVMQVNTIGEISWPEQTP